MIPERRTPSQTWSTPVTRREALALSLALAGALAGCASATSRHAPAATPPTPTHILRTPLGPIELGNASRIAALGVLHPNDDYLRGVAWSPDGRRVAAGGGHNLHLWDVASGQAVGTWQGHTGPVYGMAWSPKTNLLASASIDNTVRLWTGADGATVRVVRGPALAPLSLAWSPAGDMLAVGNFDGTVALVETRTGSVLTSLSGPPLTTSHGRYPYAVYGVSWAPDGQRFVSTRYDRYLLVWEARSGKVLAALQVDSQPNAVAWSPDGARFASSHDDGTVRLWDGASYARGATLAVPDSSDGWAFPLAWSSDGRLLAAARESGLVQWWNVSGAQQVAALMGHTAGVWAMSWSPDGTRVATACDDTTLRLWGVTAP